MIDDSEGSETCLLQAFQMRNLFFIFKQLWLTNGTLYMLVLATMNTTNYIRKSTGPISTSETTCNMRHDIVSDSPRRLKRVY